MSTRIYNGIKFKSDDIIEVMQQLHSIREKALEMCNGLIEAEPLKEYLEVRIAGGQMNVETHYLDVHQQLKDEFTLYRDAALLFPFLFTVYVVPHTDGHIYGGLFNSNCGEYRKLIEPFIEDYHYQNQTDKPDHISDADWSERARTWDEIFDKFWTFGEAGLRYDVVRADDLFIHRQIKDVMDEIRNGK